jgi:hypothetical protein
MNKRKLLSRFCLWACAVAFTLALPMQFRAQVPVADTSKPLIVKNRKSKPAEFWGQVISFNAQAIQVRQQNARQIRIFSYTPKLSASMSSVVAKGGYRRGDSVLIFYAPGSDVASRIKGKPSKGR